MCMHCIECYYMYQTNTLPPLPPLDVPAPPEADTSTIDQMDRMIAEKNSKKLHTRRLDPLPEHGRKQF